jgi:hypothetical protein
MPVLNRREAAALALFFQRGASGASLTSDFPREDSTLAREVVGASHTDLAKVQKLVEEHPSLVNACWDWGFGDWETPLGAASHVGRRPIAEYLLSKGARLDIFAAAMLGMTDAVKAMLQAQPGLQRAWGPHGITLLAHAKAGGPQASSTLAYLESLGDAGIGPKVMPVSEDRRKLILGKYQIEARPVEVRLSQNGTLQMVIEGSPRNLFHKGEDVYFPSGVPSVGFRFEIKEGKSTGFQFLNPDSVAVAKRME